MKKEEAILVLEKCKQGDVISDEILNSIIFMINLSKSFNYYNQSVERVGECFTNKFGDTAKIIEYVDSNHVTIEFQDKNKANITTCYGNLKKGDFKNPYSKRVFDIGCIGNTRLRNQNGDKKKSYTIWFAMMQRCYKDCFENKTTYIDCVVCDEWLCYENFEKWFDKNYYEIPNTIIDLDKDIFKKENKVYSPETCCFVPQDINKYFTERSNSSGLPSGVYKNKSGTYGTITCSSWDGKASVRLGTYNTAEEARHAFLRYKYKCIKEKANFYKDYLPEYIYNKLMEFGDDVQ